jgi:transposase
MRKDTVTMTRNELRRLEVVRLACDGAMTNCEAAQLLGLCTRQVIRLKNRFRLKGAEGLIHGNTGRKPVHAISDDCKQAVLQLFQEKYFNHNFSHFTEQLCDNELIMVSRPTVSRILRASGIKSKKSVKHRHRVHQLRQRKEAAGMMWQTDASRHLWFGRDYGYATLHAYIDDATGEVTGAFFTENECLLGYTQALRLGITRYGLPLCIYSDRHSIFRAPKELTLTEELKGLPQPMSNYGKALKELGIEQILAQTPEAKGRIERLWNTFQDRLVAELGLMGITNIIDANEMLGPFLCRFNDKFTVEPRRKDAAYMALDRHTNLDLVFSVRKERKAGGGNAVSYDGNLYVPTDPAVFLKPRVTVEVRQTAGGEIYVIYKGEAILMKAVDMPIKTDLGASMKKAGVASTHKPAYDHPWRSGYRNSTICHDTTSIRDVTFLQNI